MEKKFNNNKKPFNSKNKGYRKSNKGQERDRDNLKKPEDEIVKGKVPMLTNDWRYYAISEQLAKAVGNIPFNLLPGRPLSINAQGTVEGKTWSDGTMTTLPSVMQISYIPSIGYSDTGEAAINIAAKRLYTFVRHANSGAKVYEAPDLMMYIIAMENCYRLWWEARRAYQVCTTYEADNRNLPLVLGGALNLDVAGSAGSLAQANFELNDLRNKINSFWVPNIFNSFKRASVITNGVFMDSDSMRGQFYVYSMAYYYKFSGRTSETGSQLIATETGSAYSLLDKISLVRDAINALIVDDDINTMSGDMMKAFKDSDRFSLPEVPSIDKLQIAFDEDILAQIENSCSISIVTTSVSLDITQANANIVFKPIARVSTTLGIFEQLMWGSNKLFNSHVSNPDFKQVLEWTRDICCTSANGKPVFGAEIITEYNIWYNEAGSITGTNIDSYLAENTTDSGIKGCLLSNFDWHPIIYYARVTGNSYEGVGYYADVKYFTQISPDVINHMHDCAIQALYYASTLPF